MNTLVIIRTCRRDDFISWLAYKTFKDVGAGDKFIFYAEEKQKDEYRWITKTGEEIFWREHCSNFGGRSNLKIFLKGLRQIDTTGYDYVIVSDSDIIMEKNPFDGNEFELGGVQQAGNPRHFSGQLIIYSGKLFQKVIHYPEYDILMEQMIRDNYSIADDTVMTWIATMYTDKTFDFDGKEYWRHVKLQYMEKLFDDNGSYHRK